MRVKTNRGEVELTAADVRPGMVFRHEPRGRDIIVVRPYLAASKTWECNPGGVLFVADRGIDDTWSLLGCDPAVAARHNCEVYGIAPGIDAGAHGFARLRDGGAVDLRNVAGLVPGMVFRHLATGVTLETCAEYLSNARWRQMWEEFAETWHFIGLSADLARPEDVERLCCGERRTTGGLALRCTLAIGDHEEHEDIATGARWSAKPETYDRVTLGGVTFPPSGAKARTPGKVEPQGTLTIGDGPSAVTLPCASVVLRERSRMAKVAIAIDETTPKHAIDVLQGWLEMGDGAVLRTRNGALRVLPMEWESIENVSTPGTKFTITVEEEHPAAEVAFVGTLDARASLHLGDGDATCTLRHDGTFACACGSTAPGAHRDGCKLPWQHEAAAQEAWMALANGRGWDAAVKAADNALTGAAAVTVLAWCCAADGFRERERRAKEAPLVALVVAVPEGLDARGWTAAVLAFREALPSTPSNSAAEAWDKMGMTASLRDVARSAVSFHIGGSSLVDVAATAYACAIAPPGPRPAPFRRKAPGLPVDDGRDA